MAELNPAKPSPRIVDHVLYWYEKDTFTINLNIQLKDADNFDAPIPAGAQINIEIKNDKKRDLFVLENLSRVGNVFKFVIDDESTNRLKVGTYYFDIVYIYDNSKTTISHLNKIIVE